MADPTRWFPLGPGCVVDGQLGIESSGRGPVAGRVTAIALAPDDPDHTIYAGTAMGGVWKSTDAGLNWTPMTDDQLSLSVGAMAVEPNAPGSHNRLYVAAGEGNDGGEIFAGTGVLVYDPTMPTGNQWALKLDTGPKKWLDNIRSTAIVLDSRPPALMRILVGTNKGLIESTDDGATWNQIPVGTSPRVSSVVFDPGIDPTTSRLYVAIWGKGIFRQIGNAGFTQVPQGPPDGISNASNLGRITLALSPDHPLVIYAVCADTDGKVLGIYRSFDGAEHWHSIPLPSNDIKQGQYNVAFAVHPTQQATFLYGETKLWRTENSGSDWELVSEPRDGTEGIHADQHVVVFNPGDPTKVWAGNDGGVWFSGDGGRHWRDRNRGLQTMQFYALAQHPIHESLLLAGSQDNGTQRFRGHPGWDLVNFGDGFFCAIDPQQPKYWYSSYVFQPNPKDNQLEAIYRSDEAGDPDSWDRIVDGISSSDTTDRDPFYVPFVIDPSQTNVLYLGTTKLYRTTNRGGRWAPIKRDDNGLDFSTGTKLAQVITAIAVSPGGLNVVYVGTADGQFFRLILMPSGKWQVSQPLAPVDPLDLPQGYISDIAVAPDPTTNPPKKVYVAIGSKQYGTVDTFAGGRIFRSYDEGAHWVRLGGPTLDRTISGFTITHQSNAVNAIALDPDDPTHVYIGCNSGVFKSEDEGNAWLDWTDNLPNVAVADLQIHAGTRLLRAATIGRSVWERSIRVPAAAAPAVDLFIRDSIVDLGRGPTPSGIPDPLHPSDQITFHSGADIKLDTPFPVVGGFQTPQSTLDYTPGGAIDYIGFQRLGHDNARRATTSRLYVQVLNRGPDDADNVFARAFYGMKTAAGYVDLPADFWTAFPNSDPADTSAWRPIGPKREIVKLRQSEPMVVSWDWDVPSGFGTATDIGDNVGLFVVVSCLSDPVTETRRDVNLVAGENKHVALREISVGLPSVVLVGLILVALGGAALLVHKVAP
jgi:photosystem II stability/assembly factor-like uncharacterized protein